MAKAVVGAELKIDGLDRAGQSVGSFKKQLREAINDVVTMSDKFGVTSTQAAAAAKRVAELKDRIGDAKALADTFNPDKKFVAFGGVLQGVTSGFSALSGAMGIFGAEGKEVEEVLLKVQSAMALQQGLSGVKASIDSFTLLGGAIKASTAFQKANNIVTAAAVAVQRLFGVSVTGTGVAFQFLKGAIVATGFGALVVVLVLVAEKMGFFSDATEDAAESQRKLKEQIDETKSSLDDILKNSQNYIDRQIEIVKNNEKIADLQASYGNHEKEIAALRKKNIAIELENVRVELATKDDLLTTQEKLALKTKEYQLIKAGERVDIELTTKQLQKEQEQRDKNAEALQREKDNLDKLAQLKKGYREKEAAENAEYFKALEDEENARAEAERQRLITNEQLRLETKQALAEQAIIDDPDSIENRIAKANADFELEMANFNGNEIQRQNLVLQHTQEISNIKREAAERDAALQQYAQEQALTSAASALGALSNLVGQQTAAGKVLAIAEATINTFKAGLQIFAAQMPGPPPVALAIKIASMVAAIATGIATVKKIVSTPVPGKATASAAPSAPSLPSAPILPKADSTRLDQDSINAVGNAASRAFVLETDVTNNQERIRRLNRAARIN